jgi:hypothetical protein
MFTFRYTPCLTDFTFEFIRRPTPPILSPSYWTFVELTLVNDVVKGTWETRFQSPLPSLPLLQYPRESSSPARPEATSVGDADRRGWKGVAGAGSLGSSVCYAFMAVAWSWAWDLTGQICRPLGFLPLLLHLRWPEASLEWRSAVSKNKAATCSSCEALPRPAVAARGARKAHCSGSPSSGRPWWRRSWRGSSS